MKTASRKIYDKYSRLNSVAFVACMLLWMLSSWLIIHFTSLFVEGKSDVVMAMTAVAIAITIVGSIILYANLYEKILKTILVKCVSEMVKLGKHILSVSCLNGLPYEGRRYNLCTYVDSMEEMLRGKLYEYPEYRGYTNIQDGDIVSVTDGIDTKLRALMIRIDEVEFALKRKD